MKNFLILLFIFIALPVYSQDAVQQSDIEVIQNLGIFNKTEKSLCPRTEIKNLFKLHEKYTNANDVEGLKTLYADKYISFDGFGKDIYMQLAAKTWKTFRSLKYRCVIRNIKFTDENQALVETDEYINGLSYVGTKYIKDGLGLLENSSRCIYMLEKINGKWLIISDNIFYEHTLLTYGNAKFIPLEFSSPNQVKAGDKYTVSLKMLPPKNSIVVASLAKEEVTFPQISAEEVFRKLPESNLLERVVSANSQNINEYAVSFVVVMNAVDNHETDSVGMNVSGVAIGMNRVNVVPKNKFIRVDDEKGKEHK